MKNLLFNSIVIFICGFLLSLVFYQTFLEHEPEPEIIKHDSIITKYDTIHDTTTIRKPYPVFRDTGTFKIVRLPADTAAILSVLNDYNEMKVYRRQVIKNDALQVTIQDTVHRNSLFAGVVTYDMFKKTSVQYIINEKIRPPKHSLYIGVQSALCDTLHIAPVISYQTGRHAFDISGNQKYFSVSYKYLIFSK